MKSLPNNHIIVKLITTKSHGFTVELNSNGINVMARERQGPRKPAMKFNHLQKKQLQNRIPVDRKGSSNSASTQRAKRKSG